LIVHVLTESGRRKGCMARGAFRSKSRLFGVLDLFDTLELEWTERRSSGLIELRAAELVIRRRDITRDVTRYRAAHAGLELAAHAAREEARDPRLYHALEALFDHLGETRRNPGLELVAFDLELLEALGLAPALTLCAACGEAAPPVEPGRAAFSASAGGRLCSNCATRERASGQRVGTLPLEVLGGAALLATTPAAERALLPPPPAALFHELVDFVDRFLEYHLETRLRTRLSPT
jgi:DNA repair protein RecO (recombination protein O)